MKLLAVFGFALAVFAMEVSKPTSGNPQQLIEKPLFLLELFEADPSNRYFCSKVLSMVYRHVGGLEANPKVIVPLVRYCLLPDRLAALETLFKDPLKHLLRLLLLIVFEGEIRLTESPDVIFPLVRYCLETNGLLFSKDIFHNLPANLLADLSEMNAVYAAAFIFMFRIRGNEEAAECLYNAVMERRFPEEFKNELHKRLYISYPREYFNSLTKEHDKQFFVLWTVQMYDKRQEHESEDAHQERLLKCSEEVTRALVIMGFPLDLQVWWMVRLSRKLPADIALHLLTNFQLMLVSFTEDEYLKLQKPEQIQLRAFLGRYLKFRWSHLIMPAERLSKQEFEQFQEAFDLEDRIKKENFLPYSINDLVKYLCLHIKLRCPAFLLKGKFDFCSREMLFPSEAFLNEKHGLLRALIEAREIVGKGECQHEILAYNQINRVINKCNEEIGEVYKKKPEVKVKWEDTLSGKWWAEFKKKSKEACADLELYN